MATNIETENVVTRFVTEYDEASGRRAARQAERITGNIGGGFDKTARSAKGSFDKIERDSRKSLKGVEGNFKKTESRVSTLFKNFGTKLAAIGIGAAIGATINKAISQAADFETLNISFKTLTGNVETAKALIEELNKFSLVTPFQPEEINQSARVLLGFGRSAKAVTEDIEIIGNAAAATGGDLRSLAVVYGQVAGAGRLQGQDALQFINNGLPIYQLLAESLGKSTAELKKLQEQGKITFSDVETAFKGATEQGGLFFNALEEQSKTFNGLKSTFIGFVNEALRGIGGVFLPAAKNTLRSLIDLTSGFVAFIKNNTNGIRDFVGQISSSILGPLRQIGRSFARLFESFSGSVSSLTIVEALFTRIARTFAVFGNAVSFVVNGFTSFTNKIRDLLGDSPRLLNFFNSFSSIFTSLPSVLNGGIRVLQLYFKNAELQFDKTIKNLRILYLKGLNYFKDVSGEISLLEFEVKTINGELNGRTYAQEFQRGVNEIDDIKIKFDTTLDKEEVIKPLSEVGNEVEKVTKDINDKTKKSVEAVFGPDLATQALFVEQFKLRTSAIEEQIRLNEELANNTKLTEEQKAEAVKKNSIVQLVYQREILQIQQALLKLNGGSRLEILDAQKEISEIDITIAKLNEVKDVYDDLVNPNERLSAFDSLLRKIFPEGDLNTIKSDLQTLYGELINLASVFSQERERILDNELAAAETRVNDILNLNKNASQEQLNFEKSRLEAAAKARERFSKRSAAAAKVETIANIVAALAKIGAESGVASFATLPAFLTLFAGLASASAQIFHEGTESVSDKKGNRAPSDKLRSNEVFAVLEKKERVMTVKQNAALAGMSNDDVVKYATIGKKIGSAKINGNVLQIFSDNTGQQRELKKMTNAIISMERTIKNMNIESKQSIDANGVSQMVSAGMKKVEKQLKRIR